MYDKLFKAAEFYMNEDMEKAASNLKKIDSKTLQVTLPKRYITRLQKNHLEKPARRFIYREGMLIMVKMHMQVQKIMTRQKNFC